MDANETVRQIQREYLAMLDSQMGNLGKEFDDALANDPGHEVASDPYVLHEFVKQYLVREMKDSPGSHLALPLRLQGLNRPRLFKQVEELCKAVSAFWDSNYMTLADAIRSSRSSALMTQIGDLDGVSSYYLESSVRLGLYFDAICLVDPLSVIADRVSVGDLNASELVSPGRLYAIIKDYLHLRYLRPLLTASTDFPIAIVFPSRCIAWAGDHFRSLRNLSEFTTSSIFSELFQTDYKERTDAIDDVRKRSLDELDELVKRHVVVSEFLTRHECKHLRNLDSVFPRTQQDNYLEKIGGESIYYFGKLFGGLEGQFLALNGAEVLAHDLGIDIARPREHWEPNKHRMTTDGRLAMVQLPEPTIVQCAVLSEATEFLQAATMLDMVRWRENGILEGVRDLYRVDRRKMQSCTPDNLQATVDSLVHEVRERINADVAKLKTTEWFEKEKLERSGFNLAMTLAFGLASNCFAQPIGWLLAGASTIIATDSIPQYILQRFESDKTLTEAANSPAFHMHDLINRAAMIEAVEGKLTPKLH